MLTSSPTFTKTMHESIDQMIYNESTIANPYYSPKLQKHHIRLDTHRFHCPILFESAPNTCVSERMIQRQSCLKCSPSTCVLTAFMTFIAFMAVAAFMAFIAFMGIGIDVFFIALEVLLTSRWLIEEPRGLIKNNNLVQECGQHL